MFEKFPELALKNVIFAVGTLKIEKAMDSAFKKEKVPLDTFKFDIFEFVALRSETFTLFALR